ncbi:MAG: hypothetical protein JGK28_09625 [Microcoleus sp. PH2017_07_MST_O_A]|jgi:hypothetical protein|uniref:hypothetical protein n=1 Tax=unclassified Microcoleus TaxID=2642155 RepID=UPI001D3705F8|nr:MULTISPECIES: hypothetical protein [unclassified Microcoleus]MCC3418211.1 hypothetical protein [Microcoleus sp. PH2017_07_MST_O_A]MCC3465510.1 hypothetical protein [Microcoleus sp. PH2017_06_SFM_O_A]TAG07322.1 MAG: hypothetical protein EAZ45_02400 [Oscillatoriales cyanobacterium]MCC3434692.1 hypothetical protein [Microcoleus sp. PH2017_05_CCC_O_A]MCC3455172.1 hypothetical protein [Microcoleus sp. PH2017_08_TRC_O_A]
MPSQNVTSQSETQESKVLPTLTNNILPEARSSQPTAQLQKSELTVFAAQEIVYKFFIYHINNSEPEVSLQEFKKIFIELIAPVNPKLIQSLYIIIEFNSQQEFNNLFKRCSYILLNNWISNKQYELARKLITIISERTLSEPHADNILKRLKVWLTNFVSSQDYENIKLFVLKYGDYRPVEKHWTSRYQPYLLATQYLDTKNTLEARQTAKLLSQKLKDKYKFDLAMYTSRSQSATFKFKNYHNPTLLGEEALRLIKIILVNRGSLNYRSLANLFISHSQNITYKQFKESLIKYLCYYNEKKNSSDIYHQQLINILDNFHPQNDEESLNSSLLLRTCNYLIKCLTVENSGEPTALFLIFVTQLNPLTLAILMLKIILISPYSQTYLELCFARLIEYYQDNSAAECQWLIKFLEVCQIALTIYGDNVQYNLVNMSDNNQEEHLFIDLNNCRVFSQHKQTPKNRD